jgi:dissimilatory sulfite reductase (desulfoviridin) alpha/beta subunit
MGQHSEDRVHWAKLKKVLSGCPKEQATVDDLFKLMHKEEERPLKKEEFIKAMEQLLRKNRVKYISAVVGGKMQQVITINDPTRRRRKRDETENDNEQ